MSGLGRKQMKAGLNTCACPPGTACPNCGEMACGAAAWNPVPPKPPPTIGEPVSVVGMVVGIVVGGVCVIGHVGLATVVCGVHSRLFTMVQWTYTLGCPQ